MADLANSKTRENLLTAFAAESQANRRYVYFAQRAEREGYPDLASLFRAIAEVETGHAFGNFDLLARASGGDVPTTSENLRAAIEIESEEANSMYPEFAHVAHEEGFDEVAEWFATLARTEKSHVARLQGGLEALET